jgi:hypothetical protein
VPLQLNRSRFVVSGSRNERAKMRREFDRLHCIVLPALLDAPLLEVLRAQVARAKFYTYKHKGFVGRDLQTRPNPAAGVLNILLNDPALLELLRDVTGCRAIRSFEGRVRRLAPSSGNVLSWHDDATGGRLLAVTLNLGEPYRGGRLQIRDRSSNRIIREIANTGAGDAVIFRVSPAIEHRNTNVVGKVAKTSFSGWFVEADGFADTLDKRIAAKSAGGARRAKLPPVRVDASARVAIPSDVVWRRFGEGIVVVRASDGFSYRLDEVGSRIWELATRGSTPRTIANRLANEYAADLADIERDVVTLLADLAAKHLVEPGTPRHSGS